MLKGKKQSRIERDTPQTDGTSPSKCKSCGESGHRSAASSECRNHNLTLKQICERSFGDYERYTKSITLDCFLSNDDHLGQVRNKIIRLSSLLREVVYKAQTVINFYILKYPSSITVDIFKQNFWYRVCRVIYGNITIQRLQEMYPALEHLVEAYQTLNEADGVDTKVSLTEIKNYGQVISTACETIATCYNNYYVENFESIIANYLIYIIRVRFEVSTCYLTWLYVFIK